VLLTPRGSKPIISKYFASALCGAEECGMAESTIVWIYLPPVRAWWTPEIPGPPTHAISSLIHISRGRGMGF
jgi:hypothetical protein